MSPLVLIVFVPVIVGGVAFVALLLGAAASGAWEAIEQGPQGRPSAPGSARPQVVPPEQASPHTRAA